MPIKDLNEVSSVEELEELLRQPPSQDTDEDTADTTPSDDSPDRNVTPETTETQEPQELSDEELDALLQRLDPREIIRRHPGVQGSLGALAQKQARELAAKELEEQRRRERELQDQQEEEELVRLAEENPEAAARGFAERTARKRSQNSNVAREQSIREEYGAMLDSEMNAIYETPIMRELANSMTDEQIVRLWWKNGEYNSFAAWAQGMLQQVREFGREEGRKEAAKSAPSNPRLQSQAPTRTGPRTRTSDDYSSGLGESIDDTPGKYGPGSVKKMDFSEYARHRDEILKSIQDD
jgi:hypothetical protein